MFDAEKFVADHQGTDVYEIIELAYKQGRKDGHSEQLPPAQPEIIYCKDCDWWTKQEDSPQGRCALLQMYPTGGWFCGNARRRTNEE